jgi:uncharacterized protein (TIGR03435 family)
MFSRFLKIAASAALTLFASFAQPAPPPTFEVASIKPSPTPAEARAAGRNIGMKIDGARVDIGLASLSRLIQLAYNVKGYQIEGPDWMAGQRFDIPAKLPAGATREQVPAMLQALLAERFKLAVRREAKEQTVYVLVAGKDDPRLQEAAPGAPTPGKPLPKRVVLVVESSDGRRTYAVSQGLTHFEAEKINMTDLAMTPMPYVDDTPVFDMTGLKGYYQIVMEVPGLPNSRRLGVSSGMAATADAGPPPTDAPDPAGSIFASAQRLGLQLEKRKAPVEHIVVEHLEKTPTEN